MEGENKILTKKHISERQRRARINTYLEEIQKLTDESTGTTTSSRMEKAEVLERAVTYIQSMQIDADQNNNSNGMSESNDREIYKHGFASCMNNILYKISTDQKLCSQTNDLEYHLGNFLQNRLNQTEEEVTYTYKNGEGHEEFQSTFGEDIDASKNMLSLSDLESEQNYLLINISHNDLRCELQNSDISNFVNEQNSSDKTDNSVAYIYPERASNIFKNSSVDQSGYTQAHLSSLVLENECSIKLPSQHELNSTSLDRNGSISQDLQMDRMSEEIQPVLTSETEGASIVWRPW